MTTPLPADPNFPPNLDIKPLALFTLADVEWKQEQAISKFGIAGRVWEATQPLIQYLTPHDRFDPPCSLFHGGPHRVIELGSGQSLPSLHLASQLGQDDLVVLTDLPQVMELCEQNITVWKNSKPKSQCAHVVAEPLAWGSSITHLARYGPYTHILMCDLIYFPHLYPPLLRTLLELTESSSQSGEEETFGPEIILSYKSRTLALEESFFDAFGQYFRMMPVVGGEWEAKVFICRRWRTTEEWALPDATEAMSRRPGIVRGRDFGLIDQLFGSLEWEV